MNFRDFDSWCRTFLDIHGMENADSSLNGVQVARRDDTAPLERVAFAVDACAESFRRAAEAGAQVLFVHHGLFWGKPLRFAGPTLRRLRILIDSDIALYACHLPLDKHPEVGNNAVLARLLGLINLKGFGGYRGSDIGFFGGFPQAIDLDQAIARVLPDGSRPRSLIPAGPTLLRNAAVMSGGAPYEVDEAIERGIDLYVTGEPSHGIYHPVIEAGISFMAAGHYATETWGVRAVAERLARETGLQSLFIDLPTGL